MVYHSKYGGRATFWNVFFGNIMYKRDAYAYMISLYAAPDYKYNTNLI